MALSDAYFRCLLTSFVISNMFEVALREPLQRVVGLDHALVLLSADRSSCVGHSFFVSSVRGSVDHDLDSAALG